MEANPTPSIAYRLEAEYPGESIRAGRCDWLPRSASTGASTNGVRSRATEVHARWVSWLHIREFLPGFVCGSPARDRPAPGCVRQSSWPATRGRSRREIWPAAAKGETPVRAGALVHWFVAPKPIPARTGAPPVHPLLPIPTKVFVPPISFEQSQDFGVSSGFGANRAHQPDGV